MSHDIFETTKRLRHEAEKAVEAAVDLPALGEANNRLTGRQSELQQLFDAMKTLAPEDKKAHGKELNQTKAFITQLVEEKKRQFKTEQDKTREQIDLTLPGTPVTPGRRHIITQTVDEILAIFRSMGFNVVEGPEIEDNFHNFDALNTPATHPARAPEDNFYIDDDHLLRTQTSTVQIRAMEEYRPPLRIVAPGRVYRPDTVDSTHHYQFFQIEGLVIDRNLKFADLKGTLLNFARALFGHDVKVRFRPHYFPFTEPSAEMDLQWAAKSGGWLEMLGCGMVHPNVLKAVGLDPQEWSGFAFGMGPERLAMVKYGIDEIRLFTENDVRFLRQF